MKTLEKKFDQNSVTRKKFVYCWRLEIFRYLVQPTVYIL